MVYFEGGGSAAARTGVDDMSARFQTAEAARQFMLGGNAVVTLQSEKTGARFTYKITAAPAGPVSFVKVLTGQDNESNYEYVGLIKGANFARTAKSRISGDAPSVKALEWAWKALSAGRLPETLAVYHEGRCGRCNRLLTVPESIESGFGPECSRRMAA
jgi:hypothetical protein